MRVFRVALVAIATAALAGCFQSSTVIKLKPDGSGTLEQTITMSTEAVAQFSALAAMGDDKNKKGASGELFSEKDARDAAAKMGQGVTFVSSERIDTADRKGLKAIYAFTDIRTLAVDEMMSPSNVPKTGGGMTASAKDPPITFDFEQLPGGHSLLTIQLPHSDKGLKPDGAASTSKDAVDPKMAEQGLEMMKMFMKGLRVDFTIDVPHVIKTNSPYVSGGTVTVLSMDFDQVLADPTALERLNGATRLSETQAALKDVKGIKVLLEPKLTIEFAGR